MRCSRWVVLSLLLLKLPVALGGGEEAREVTLFLRDGREVRGLLVAETADSITVRSGGVDRTFPRDRIDEVHRKVSLEEQYRDRRSALEDEDMAGRYRLARWLFEHHRPDGYRLALDELEEILEFQPDHHRAGALHRVVRGRLDALEDEVDLPSSLTAGAPSPQKGERTLKPLRADQVAAIRVYEVDLRVGPRVRIPEPVIDALFGAYAGHEALAAFEGPEGRARFGRLPGYVQLEFLFEVQARDRYHEVEILDEPASLQIFRTAVQPRYVGPYCGRCHRGGEAPGLDLLTRGQEREQVAYANLLSLRHARVGEQRVIDTAVPRRSLLAQYGLPRALADEPHPEVEGWRPYFHDASEPGYRQLVEWIGMLWGAEETYPIDFQPPVPSGEGADEDGAV